MLKENYSCSIVTRNESLKAQAALIEIFLLCWNLPSGSKHQAWLQKKHCFHWRDKQFAGNFVLTYLKQRMIWFNLQWDETRNRLSNIKDTFAENICQVTNVISATKYQHLPRLVSQIHMMLDGWAKCKEEVRDVSDSSPNVETTFNSKLKFTKLKDLFIKRVQKN